MRDRQTRDDWSGARVRTLRRALGLSQERFAARVNATAGTVSKWESGEHRPQPMACALLDRLEQEAR